MLVITARYDGCLIALLMEEYVEKARCDDRPLPRFTDYGGACANSANEQPAAGIRLRQCLPEAFVASPSLLWKSMRSRICMFYLLVGSKDMARINCCAATQTVHITSPNGNCCIYKREY
jgi:hypothetical protein